MTGPPEIGAVTGIEGGGGRNTMPKAKPLWMRLYREPPLFELARVIGYDVLPLTEGRERRGRWAERYGKDVMERASKETVRIDAATTPPTVRLTDEARRLCWQLLGPPPEPNESAPGDPLRAAS